MSAYTEMKTELKNGELIVEALKAMGFTPTVCIGDPQPLVGYQGDYRTADGNGHTRDKKLAMKADIIIPRSQVGGASNDIGFVQRDGKFHPIISQYDSSRYDASWLTGLKVKMGEVGIEQQAKKLGLRLAGKTVEKGKIKYQYIMA